MDDGHFFVEKLAVPLQALPAKLPWGIFCRVTGRRVGGRLRQKEAEAYARLSDHRHCVYCWGKK